LIRTSNLRRYMVRLKKDWLLHKNVISRYSGQDTYSCGAPVEDRGDITDEQALSLPLCPRCFKEGEIEGMVDVASAKGGGEGEASAKRSDSSSRRMEGWL
jgi:hypothetical protein